MDQSNIAIWGTLAASIATAIATFFLWRVTMLLAKETKRMADLSARPQIVASIIPNQWSTIHLDVQVENTGNASAFEIEISFDPPLENGEAREDRVIPFEQISVLKPGQVLQSYLSGVGDYLKQKFTVTASWKLHPDATERENLVYTLNMSDYQGISYLGSRDPVVQIAEQIKKLRDDWRYVASGSRKIKTDVHTSDDRRREQEALEKQYQRNKDKSEEK